MAKANGNKGDAGEEKVNGGSAPAAKIVAPPAGYQQTATQVDQFWTEESGPIHGKLLAGKPYVNKANGQENLILVFELLEPCGTQSSKGEKFERPATRGELVGVWKSAGMKELLGLGGCAVWMAREGTKDLGNKKTLKTYKIVYKGLPVALRLIKPEENVQDGHAATEAAQDQDPF